MSIGYDIYSNYVDYNKQKKCFSLPGLGKCSEENVDSL